MNTGHSSRIPAALVTVLFGVRLLLLLADLLAALMAFHAPDLYDRFGEPLDRLWVATPWVYMVWGVAFAVWVYQYHRDLRRMFTEYPITPWGAIARTFIPIYHYWGFWNTWDTAHKHFDGATGPRPRMQVRQALVIFYAAWLVFPLLKRMPAMKEWVWFNSLHTFQDLAVYALVFWAATQTLKLTPALPEPVAEAS